MTEYRHEPVLLDEVIRWAAPRPFGVIIDCTLGGGRYAEGILAKVAGRATLLGLDRDPEAIAAAERRLEPYAGAVRLRRAPFSRLAEVARAEGIHAADVIALDLGPSSHQFDRPERGFSYLVDAPLDLRMDPTQGETAADLLARLNEEEIAEILRRCGEEPRARAIARRIARAPRRPRTTGDLAAIVRSVAPRPAEPTLSRTFMALRSAINREIEELDAVLPQAVDLLAPEGRLVAVAYHSLEDRPIKEFIRREARGCICPPDFPACTCGRAPRLEILTRRAVRPSPEEVRRNPRARSARLRAARRLPGPTSGRSPTEAP